MSVIREDRTNIIQCKSDDGELVCVEEYTPIIDTTSLSGKSERRGRIPRYESSDGNRVIKKGNVYEEITNTGTRILTPIEH